MRISRKLKLKDNCVRSVQINPNNSRGVWNYCGTAITGIQQGENFIVDEKFKSIIDSYNPKRVNTKQNDTIIRQTKAPTEKITFSGETRVIRYTNLAKTRGIVSYGGKKFVLVKDKINDEWETCKPGKSFFIEGIEPKSAYSKAYYYGKKYNTKFSVLTTSDGAYFTKIV